MIKVRPAAAGDVKDMHPGAEGVSYRAWSVDLDGKLVGVIGLALTRPRACLFCWFDESLRPHLKAWPVLRLLKKVETLIRERGLPVYAIRQADEPKAAKILTRLGFMQVANLDGDEVWEFN